MDRHLPLNPSAPRLLHGADYNPEQWLHVPGILEQDIAMMQQAGCNIMSVGIFSWSALEPSEGHFTFEWMDTVLDKLYEGGISVFLATPGGGKPAWLAARYPETLRVSAARVKALHGGRHNHCLSSPVYKEKVTLINQKLAQRYARHPAVLGWHINNEYGGECHCDRCQQDFRRWLKTRYKTLDALNHAWWTGFWSHTYSDWSQIESPSPQGETSNHGLNLDWRRFVTAQVKEFYLTEVAPLKAERPELPATTNFMWYFNDYDYWQLKDVVDFVSWDSYPMWHKQEDERAVACKTAMYHDLMRTLKARPFVLMESSPGQTSWQPVSKLKKTGMHILSSLQAVAHGADAVQYFQWRKSRGAVEKFHGAVVDHVGHLDTRTGREVIRFGEILSALSPLAGTKTRARVAIVFDWENRWAVNDAAGPRNCGIHYEQTVVDHYRPFWEQGVAVDIINADCDLSGYALVIAPMLYMVRDGFAERAEAFVRAGGYFVTTYWSGIVNETDLCHMGGFPGPLRPLLGIWAEEIDCLNDEQSNGVKALPDSGLKGNWRARELCEVIHPEGAEVLACYTDDFYAGYPALTQNRVGKGSAFYVASRNDDGFHQAFTSMLIDLLKLPRALETILPPGVVTTRRTDGEREWVFVQNYTGYYQEFTLPDIWYNAVSSEKMENHLTLTPWDCEVLVRRL
ncbi:beta-galactosidase [Salmonella enterica]|nr:beta-galactosidase [Salmonella enterica]